MAAQGAPAAAAAQRVVNIDDVEAKKLFFIDTPIKKASVAAFVILATFLVGCGLFGTSPFNLLSNHNLTINGARLEGLAYGAVGTFAGYGLYNSGRWRWTRAKYIKKPANMPCNCN